MCLVHNAMTNTKDGDKIAATSSRSSKYRISHDRIKVQHHYHDHSQDSKLGSDAGPGNQQSRTGLASPPFPNKLHEMLMKSEDDGISHIISFAPHGRAIQIHDTKALVGLLPKYFTLSKIASFQRQLNLYGFGRLTKGPDRGCYYHEYFLRGSCHEHLLEKMQRTKVKGTFVRARSNPDQEPDFWSMPWVGTDDEKPEILPKILSLKSMFRSVRPKRSVISLSSASSVVSHDDADDGSTAKPVQPRSANITSTTRENFHESEDADDVILTTWGMPFHYLSPDSLDDLPVQSRVVDLDDEKALAKALEALLNEDDEIAMYRTSSDFLEGYKL